VCIRILNSAAAFCALRVKIVLLMILFFAICGAAQADPLRVVTTGDSQTCCYWSSLPVALGNLGVNAVVPDPVYGDANAICTARGGLNSSRFAGITGYDPEATIDYSSNVLAADPDVVLFMLGINDMAWDNVETRFVDYKNNLLPEFDKFAAFTNSKGVHPKFIIGSIVLHDVAKQEAYLSQQFGYPVAHDFDVPTKIAEWNSWLQQEAASHGFQYLDNFDAMQQVPDWKNQFFGVDGLHFNDQGNMWMATQFASVVVSEPSSLVLFFAAGLVGFMTRAGWRLNRLRAKNRPFKEASLK
jgi:lysophospholipase L1-like esterase